MKHLLEVAVDREEAGGTTYLTLRSAGIFTNYLSLKAIILEAGKEGSVVLDISKSPLVDHTTMERLHDLVSEFQHDGKTFRIDGGERLAKLSQHPMAVRRSVLPPPA